MAERERPAVPRVVHCKRESFDVYIGRPSKWGNPFRMNTEDERLAVIDRYRHYLHTRPDLLAALDELRGKTLGCWCKPKPCHGDVLVQLANQSHQDAAIDYERT